MVEDELPGIFLGELLQAVNPSSVVELMHRLVVGNKCGETRTRRGLVERIEHICISEHFHIFSITFLFGKECGNR